MSEQPKSWKERKQERDAHANQAVKRSFIHKSELLTPGNVIHSMDGTEYYIAKDGSRRRARQV
jgi:hypothetical protein